MVGPPWRLQGGGWELYDVFVAVKTGLRSQVRVVHVRPVD
jgi:hypothetical protein